MATVSTYRVYSSFVCHFALDHIAVVEMKDGVECTDEYADSEHYYVKSDSVSEDEADKIYQAGQTLAEYGLLHDSQVEMKTFRGEGYQDEDLPGHSAPA